MKIKDYEISMSFTFKSEEQIHKIVEMMQSKINFLGAVSVYDYYLYSMPGFGLPDDKIFKEYGWSKMDTYEIVDDGSTYTLTLPDPQRIIMHCEEKSGSDMINHPNHYKSETGLETIDVIEAFTFDLKGIEATDTGNILKYMCRWKSKNGLEDLKKARWYLNHLINHVEKLEKEND